METTAPHPNLAAFAPGRPVAAAPVSARARRRLPWGRLMLGTGAALAVALAAGLGLHHAAGFESTDDAFLEGNVHPVSARVNGTVIRVLVDDNAHVTAGQPLLEIDPADLDLAAQSSEADLAQARASATQVAAQVKRAGADVDAAIARLEQNGAELRRAELDFHRMEHLSSDAVGAVSRQEFELARAQFDASRAAQQSLRAQQSSAEAALVATRAQSAVADALVQKAGAVLATARLQVDYTVVRAPAAGRVAKKSVEVGQRLQPGQPVLSVVSDDLWVVANFKEGQLGALRAGQKVEIRIDALDDRGFAGVVDSFSPGTGARFALLPPDNSTGNFTKVVQRVPVKIRFDAGSTDAVAARLSPGLSAIVRVAVRP
jgi:membrane fusion protein (multidrug efflux system)